jgi:hypothetical protein
MATGKPRIEQWENGGSTTINDAGGISNVDTTVTVTSATSFPTEGDFRIKIESEIMIVTGVSGSVFTIERGAEGTTAASHADTTAVTHVVSEDSIDRAYADNYGIDYTNGYPYNRILDEGATATASSFTWFNQGSGTCVDADDGGLLMTTGASEALSQLRGKELTAPGTPWTATAYVHLGNGMARYDGLGAGTSGGLMMRENSSGEIYYLFIRTDAIAMWRMTNSTTFSADVDTFIDNECEEIWLRMGDDGVDVFGEVSYNGYDWEVCFNEGRTSFMAGGPDRIGFGMMNGSANLNAEVYFKSWILE